MSTSTQDTPIRSLNPWRLLGWGTVVFLLLLPLVAMQFTDDVNWTLSDFIFMGVLLGLTGGLLELGLRLRRDWAYRAGVGLAVGTAFLLTWVNGAVGLAGGEGHTSNFIYLLVPVAGGLWAALVRLRPQGMVQVLLGVALLQVLLCLLTFSLGLRFPVGVTLFFVVLWSGAAGLFHKSTQAARQF